MGNFSYGDKVRIKLSVPDSTLYIEYQKLRDERVVGEIIMEDEDGDGIVAAAFGGIGIEFPAAELEPVAPAPSPAPLAADSAEVAATFDIETFTELFDAAINDTWTQAWEAGNANEDLSVFSEAPQNAVTAYVEEMFAELTRLRAERDAAAAALEEIAVEGGEWSRLRASQALAQLQEGGGDE